MDELFKIFNCVNNCYAIIKCYNMMNYVPNI